MNIEASGRHILSPTNKKEYPLVIELLINFLSEDIHCEIWNRLIEPGWSLSGGILLDHPFWHYNGLYRSRNILEIFFMKRYVRDYVGKRNLAQ